MVFLWALSGIVACSTGAGEGRIWGSVYLPDCDLEKDAFDMEIDFFAADYFDNTLSIRLQRSGQDPIFSDGLILLIRDVKEVAAAGGEVEHEIAVEPSLEAFKENGVVDGIPRTAANSSARVTLYLNGTCPGNRLAFTDGAGVYQLTHIYIPGKQKRIKGSFHLEFIDPRFWESPEDFGPHARLSGEFDFNYTRGRPAQTFP